jgi:hypothetical protein
MTPLNRARKYVLTAIAAVLTFCGGAAIDFAFSKLHILREATYIDDVLLACLAGAFIFALETYHERENRRLNELAELVVQMNHHIRNALQVISYAHVSQPDSELSAGVNDSILRIEWVLREVLCESAIRMGVRSVPQEMATREGPRQGGRREPNTVA